MATSSDLQNLPRLDLIRTLRLAGRADEACALGAELFASAKAGRDMPCYIGQLGVDLTFLGMYAEAEACLKQSLDDASISWADRYVLLQELCTAQFALGKYHEAQRHNRTLRGRSFAEVFHHLILGAKPQWREVMPNKLLEMDEPVAGMRILVHAEGGFGDFVMFSRYVDTLLREGAREVAIEASPTWRQVFRSGDGVRVVESTDAQRDIEIRHCDRFTLNFSLYARYQHSPYFPAENPGARIAIDPAVTLSEEASTQLAASPEKLNVGLIWASASDVRQEPYRSIPLARLEALLSNEACRFHSLQVGEISEADRALMTRYGVTDLARHLSTFGDTARVLDKLDLLITIDTGTAHLAGALNRPVWTLLSQACDGRWLDCQRFTPWYPSMRLYRQTRLGDWTPPLADLQADLAALSACATRARGESP